MGDSEIEGHSSVFSKSKAKSISYTDCFNELCPIFMSYGMSYNDFWYGDITMTTFYLKAHNLELKEKDAEFWKQGMYIYEAILDCSPILHPFSKAKKPLPYPEKPYSIQQEEEEQITKQQIENERLKAQIWMNNWVRGLNKKKE